MYKQTTASKISSFVLSAEARFFLEPEQPIAAGEEIPQYGRFENTPVWAEDKHLLYRPCDFLKEKRFASRGGADLVASHRPPDDGLFYSSLGC